MRRFLVLGIPFLLAAEGDCSPTGGGSGPTYSSGGSAGTTPSDTNEQTGEEGLSSGEGNDNPFFEGIDVTCTDYGGGEFEWDFWVDLEDGALVSWVAFYFDADEGSGELITSTDPSDSSIFTETFSSYQVFVECSSPSTITFEVIDMGFDLGETTTIDYTHDPN